ncbi:MAG: hypothetical protein R3B82_26765 [Sandaracinaceae bacterium]
MAERFGPHRLEVCSLTVPAIHREAVTDATGRDWYPEPAHSGRALHSLRLSLAGGHRVRFGELLEACTERGMGSSSRRS